MPYSIVTSSICALPSVFDFEDVKHDFPFNIKIATKQEAKRDMRFFGPGIYSIYDTVDKAMIYIGIYTPADSVIDKRYRKHIQTLTLRGTEVTFKSKYPKNNFLSKIKSDPLILDLNTCASFEERLVKDRCVSHINKVNYAAANWNKFRKWNPWNNFNSEINNRFAFQFDKIIGNNVNKKMLQNIESTLISEFNPTTNSTYCSENTSKHDTQEKITKVIERIISE